MRRQLLFGGLLAMLPGRARAETTVTEIAPALMGYAAGILAGLIGTAREQAIADGVQPVPATVARGVHEYFPDGLLHRVRWAVGGAGRIALPSLAFTYGDAAAMTLGDVVLFRDARAAQQDLKLWAHELTHVLQYQRWGIDGFAERYVRDSRAIEKEAYDNADRFIAWQSRGSSAAR